jgi:folate-binding protein YgfZ
VDTTTRNHPDPAAPDPTFAPTGPSSPEPLSPELVPPELVPPSPLLKLPGAVPGDGIDAPVAWHYGDPVSEQRRLEAGTAVVDLSHRGVVWISGPDRLSWLHSLTTQSLLGLEPGRSTETLVLSPHGHIEHALHVVDDGETVWITVEPGTAPVLVAWLDRMRFTLRVEVADVTGAWAVLGTCGPATSNPATSNPATSLENRSASPQSPAGSVQSPGGSVEKPGAGTVSPVAEGRRPPGWTDPWPALGPVSASYSAVDPDAHPGGPWVWREILVPRSRLAEAVAGRDLAGMWAAEALRVAAWRPRLGFETDHRTIPHELDWLRTAVHLQKGCYRGQETVARVHNLGRPPRRLVLLHLDGSENVLPEHGAAVLHGEREVGRIGTAVRHHELGPVALALVKRSVPAQATLLVDGVPASQELVVAR